jgi:Flp pilus assembly protein TadG
MRLTEFCRDVRGASAVEFALTVPVFLTIVFGLMQCALLLWTKVALQHGAELAARCATVNTVLCGTTSDIQQYAAQHAYGLNPPASTFTVSTPACGNQVSANYTFQLMSYFGTPSLTLNQVSCFPK